jgi:hypothetical protein
MARRLEKQKTALQGGTWSKMTWVDHSALKKFVASKQKMNSQKKRILHFLNSWCEMRN